MPPAPKLGHGHRLVGLAEVFRQVKAHDPAQPHRHQGITVKIEIELEAVGRRRHPGQRCGDAVVAHRLYVVPQAADQVGQQHLGAKPQHEDPQPLVHAGQGGGAAPQLPGHLAVLNNGACDKLGKHTQIRPQRDQRPLRRDGFPVHIHQIGNDLKGIKADADGQNQRPAPVDGVSGGQIPQGRAVVKEKARVFEQKQPEKVIGHAQDQPQLPAGPARRQPQTHPPVDQDGQQEQQDVEGRLHRAVGVKGQTARKEQGVFPPAGRYTV